MAQGSTTTKVTATDLDIRDLTSASDSVSAAQSGTWNITNVSGTVSLPTGAATSAKQDTVIGHLDGVEGLLTTIDADTGTIAGAVSGTEMQVDVVGSLPAGTNAIGKLAANSGVDIGDVDITSVIPGTGATNLGKAIDTATGATDTGVLALATRDDALSTLTPIEGDNVQLRTDSTGALWTKISGTVTVDGSGVTQPISHAGLTELAAAINTNKVDVNIVSSDVATGGTSAADDADFTATTTTGTPAMGVYESTPTSVTDGDMGIVGITTGRRLKTSATIDTALPAGTNAIGKLSANSGVDIGDVDVTSISAGDNTIGRVKITDGTTVATVRELGTNDALNVAMVDGSGNQVTSFGGGTQYTEADTDASITGTAVMWEDTGDTLRAVSAAKPLPIGDAGGSLTIDGTVAVSGTVAVTQSGTWDEVGINDSGNSITIDYNGSAISTANAVPIQPPAAGYLAVNETGGALTALQLIDDTVYTDGSGTPSKAIGVAGTDGTNPQIIKTDTNGELQVDILSIAAGDNNIGNMDVASIAAGDNNIGNVDVVTVPSDPFGANADAAATAGSTGTMQAKFRLMTSQLDSIKTAVETLDNTVGGSELQVDIVSAPTLTVNSHAVTNAGTFAVQVDGNALTALQLIDDPVIADDAAFTPATTKVMMAGFEADESSTDSVDEGDGGAARMTLDRKQIVTQQPHTSGGLSTFMASGSDGSSILVATAQAVKASAGQLYGYYAYNPESAVTFVHFYNTAAASVTVGTTNPLFTLAIPATSAANLMFPNGVVFSNAGWSVAATTTAGGNTAPATGVSLVAWYV